MKRTTQQISRRSSLGMSIAAVLMAGVFVFPLWIIRLEAPQYPQGLGLDIRIDRIEGATPHDLQNINGLNHYIGMQRIEPDSIAELRFMKYIVAALIAGALAVGLLRRRWMLTLWVVLAVGASAAGMLDFYRWEYRYGHELDPSAAIKIPGASYQPPLFGTRQLANFRTSAWPGIGGALAMVSVALACVMLLMELRRVHCLRIAPRRVMRSSVPRAAMVLLSAALALSGCARGPKPIAFGTDACDYCAMTISDDRHGAVFVTSKGRTIPFDSIECMLQSVMEGEKHAGVSIKSWHVIDYTLRGTMIDASAAFFLVSPGVPSPMGANLSAFSRRGDAEAVRTQHGGEVYNWHDASAYLQRWVRS